MDLEKRQIPQIVSLKVLIDAKEELVTYKFLDKSEEDGIQDDKNVLAELKVSFNDYLDFALSFLNVGIEAQKKFNIDLGINIPNIDGEE